MNGNTVAYVDNENGYTLKTVTVNPSSSSTQITSEKSVDLDRNAQLIAVNGTNIAVLSVLDNNNREIYLYNGSFSQTKEISTDFSDTNVPLHHAEAAFAFTNDYIVTGYDIEKGDNAGTYISIYDATVAGTKKATHTKTNETIGELVALAVNGNYILAGGGGEAAGATGGTAVFQIKADDLSLSKVGDSDNKPTHWMKDNGTYVIESKEAGAEVKIWKWNTNGAPTAVGTIVAAGLNASGTPDLTAIRALQFDPADPNTAYVVSFNGGKVYKVDLATATLTHLFTYSKHFDYPFMAWMVERITNGSGTYFVITGGYGSGRTAPGVALVFKNPPADGSLGAPLSGVTYDGLVRMLRTVRDSKDNLYFAAKDNRASRFAIYRINDD